MPALAATPSAPMKQDGRRGFRDRGTATGKAQKEPLSTKGGTWSWTMTHHVVALPLRLGVGDFPATIGSSSPRTPISAGRDLGGAARPAGAVSVAMVLRYLATKTRRRYSEIG